MKEPQTKGENVRYNKTESEVIKQELYDFIKNHKHTKSQILKTTSTKKSQQEIKRRDKKHRTDDIVNSAEIKLDNLILSDPILYQGIQKIYRNHGVEIPSQHTIDKGEVITVKKMIIKEILNLES